MREYIFNLSQKYSIIFHQRYSLAKPHYVLCLCRVGVGHGHGWESPPKIRYIFLITYKPLRHFIDCGSNCLSWSPKHLTFKLTYWPLEKEYWLVCTLHRGQSKNIWPKKKKNTKEYISRWMTRQFFFFINSHLPFTMTY